jgi:phosphopantetheinyl transferase
MNFQRNQILCNGTGGLPGSCEEGRILLITTGLDDLPDVTVAAGELARAALMEQTTARRFLAARRVVRGIFSNILGVHPENIELTPDSNGKPSLVGNNHHFSIAHSGERVAVAVSRSRVGVDLETERTVDTRALARRFFSPQEGEYILWNPAPEHFFRLWTCREAAVKADGRGLSKLLGMTAVSIHGANSSGESEVTIGGERWFSRHWNEPERLHVALAYQKHPDLISWCDLHGEVIV